MRRVLPWLAAATVVSGCSGGGDTPSPPPAQPNSAPAFTSPATASVVENSTAAYQASASDADGDPLTFSIAGGADAAQFAITTAGALRFVAAPDFDRPTDANGDNIYVVTLQVSDGTASASREVSITVTNSREGIAVRRVATGFSQPIYALPVPGSDRIFVLERTGGVYSFDPASGTRTLAFTVGNISTDGERGLLSMAVSQVGTPSANGPYMVMATAPDGAVQLREYAAGGGSYRVTLSIPHPGFSNHNGGWVGFGPDNRLYMTVGDGGGAGDPNDNAQNPNVRLGKILRLAPNPDPTAGPGGPALYVPAPGNPYASGGGDPYVYAIGMRNPFRASFDGSRLIIGDVGQGAREEIDVIRTDQPGINFGWPYREGTAPYRGTPPAGLVDPVSEYGHGNGPRQGASVIGGYVYRGPVASLVGSYVFGDFVSGNIWTVPADQLAAGSVLPSSRYEWRNADFAPDVGTIDQLVSFGVDRSGNLFLIDLDGDIFMVVPQ